MESPVNCRYYKIPILSFVFYAVSSILLVLRIFRSKSSSKVRKFAISAMCCWILQDIQTQLFYCFISCSLYDGFPMNVSTTTYAMANFTNYLFMIEKYVALLPRRRPEGKSQRCILFIMKKMVWINGIIAVLFSLVPAHVIDTGLACVATSIGTQYLLFFYLIMDIGVTFLGIYLFSRQFRIRNYQIEEKKEGLVHVAERNHDAPNAGCGIRVVHHSSKRNFKDRFSGSGIRLVHLTSLDSGSGIRSVHHTSLDKRNRNAPGIPLDDKLAQVAKWNFIGVLVGQIPTFAIVMLSVVLQNTHSVMTYRRLVMKPFANLCNVIGIHLMFQDHRYLYAKLLQMAKNKKDARVVPFPGRLRS